MQKINVTKILYPKLTEGLHLSKNAQAHNGNIKQDTAIIAPNNGPSKKSPANVLMPINSPLTSDFRYYAHVLNDSKRGQRIETGNCELFVCDRICDRICDLICTNVNECDEIKCDYVCDNVNCDKVCDSICDKVNCDMICSPICTNVECDSICSGIFK